MFFIQSGRVRIVQFNEEKEEEIQLAELKEGMVFGELGMLIELPRTASVVTVTACVLLELKKTDFTNFVRAAPEVVDQFKNNLMQYDIPLHHLCHSPFVLEYFRKHCEQEHSTENIDFWIATRDFAKAPLTAGAAAGGGLMSSLKGADPSRAASLSLAMPALERRASEQAAALPRAPAPTAVAAGAASVHEPATPAAASIAAGEATTGTPAAAAGAREGDSDSPQQQQQQATDDAHAVLEQAKELYSNYVDPSAPNQVNISAKQREQIQKRLLSGNVERTLFKEAQAEILKLMNKDSYVRFRQSQLFRDCVDMLNGPMANVLRELHII